MTRNLLLLCSLILSGSSAALGCSCLATPTIQAEFDRVDDVVIAKIISVEKAPTDEPYPNSIKGAHMSVERVFKGNLRPGDEVFFEQGGGANCIWTYSEKQVGLEVLIYNSPYEGKRYVSECGRSSSLKFATDDLRYLQNLDKVRGKTRIGGIYKFGFFSAIPRGQSVEGKRIRILGRTRNFLAITDKDGVYEIYDVPPGKYYIEPEMPSGWKLAQNYIARTLEGYPPGSNPLLYEYLRSRKRFPNRIPVMVESSKHISLDFVYEIDNSVEGRVIDPAGKPLKGICVTAVPSEKDDFRYGPFNCTDKNGRFLITELYFNKFVLVINGDGIVSGEQPIQRQFFPGVDSRSKAKEFDIAQGTHLKLKPFRIREMLDTVTLRGTMSYSDGSIVTSHQKVQFVPDIIDTTKKKDVYDYTDDHGRFELKIMKGQAGRIRGEIIMGERQRVGCPSVLNAVIVPFEYGGGVFTAATDWLAVTAIKNESDLSLKFAFPECKVP